MKTSKAEVRSSARSISQIRFEDQFLNSFSGRVLARLPTPRRKTATHRRLGVSARSLGALVVGLAFAAPAPAQPIPPRAKSVPHRLEEHGRVRIDNYYWLRDRDDPEVIQYLEAENRYLEAAMKPTEGLQEELYREIRGRIKEDDSTAPYRHGGYYYYTRWREGEQYPLHARRKGSLEATEEILLDENRLAEGHEYFHMMSTAPSRDHDLLAYAADHRGRFIPEIRFKDLRTGRTLADVLPNGGWGSVAWAADNRTVLYVRKDLETLRPYQVWRHVLGTETTADQLVYEETDDTFQVDISTTQSKRYILIVSSHTLSTEIRYLPAEKPENAPLVFETRERDHLYNVDHLGDSFYILTNQGAKNFRLMRTPEGKTAKESWEELIPHRPDVLLEEFTLFDGFLVLGERKDGLTRLRVRPWSGDGEHDLHFDEAAYVVRAVQNLNPDAPRLRFVYTSLTTPPSTYEYDMRTRERALLKQEAVLGGYDPAAYATARLHATARDGTRVPLSLVYRREGFQRGKSPLLLYGYGSYGLSLDPAFRPETVSLLDRGFVYAIAHIRGGQEMGRQWYEDGKLSRKKNTFTDFIDAAGFLAESGHADPKRLYAMGGSAGGLLMGAVMNMRPELFHGIVAYVPFVDVVTTMLDASIPLTTFEWDEWGDPRKKEDYDYMLSYSPYDNVRATDYPNLLVTTGLHDSQVQYWEPAKWVAKLRTLATGTNRILFKTTMAAGHGGPSGRFRRYRETALHYAFLVMCAATSADAAGDERPALSAPAAFAPAAAPKLAFELHEIGRAGDKLGQTSLADIDRDGDLDFVSGSREGEVQWWEHRGADQWVRHVIGRQSPTDVGGVAFDVDGDGWIDQCSGGAWWRNPGEPWRGEFRRFENGAIGTHDNRVADVDGDGRLDLVSMRDTKGLFWYRIPEDPTQRWIEHRVGDARHSGLAPADIDGDGDVDLVVGNWWYENSGGDGSRWTKHENIPFEGRRYNQQGIATQNRAADLDGDGDLDLAITDGETEDARAAWIENEDGKGRRWKAHELASGRGALHSLAIADFDGDGHLDIFTCEMEIGGSGRWFIYTGDGRGDFEEHTIHEGVPGHESVVGDVDGDGDLDICSKPWNGGRHFYLENRRITKSPRRKPRLAVTTDIGGDPDDLQSLVRLLVTSDEFDLEGLIASASGTPGELGENIVKPHLIREAIEAYGAARESLAKHAEGFPPAASLQALVKAGNPRRGVENIGEGRDTDGSSWIIDLVDRDDPRPLSIAIWGGSTELAQALWRVRQDRGPREAAKFIARLRVHAIGHQDDTGPWILREFPALWYTLDHSQDGDKHVSAYRGMWKHGDRSLTAREWLVEHVQTRHGPLGALYPLRTWSPPMDAMKEGDTPSWFAFLENGLNVPSRPDYGGWGGRFRIESGRFRDAMDTVGDETSRMATVWRWRRAYQNELAARMDWCVRPFEEANHAPVLTVDGIAGREVIVRDVRPGAAVELRASATDPDGDTIRFRWFQYREAGTCAGEVELTGAGTSTCSFTAPQSNAPETVHIILEAEDEGAPPLTAYRRVIVRIVP